MFTSLIATITALAAQAGMSAIQWLQSSAGQQWFEEYIQQYGHLIIHKLIEYFENLK